MPTNIQFAETHFDNYANKYPVCSISHRQLCQQIFSLLKLTLTTMPTNIQFAETHFDNYANKYPVCSISHRQLCQQISSLLNLMSVEIRCKAHSRTTPGSNS
ncbi:hypothetical protein ACJMK2_015984 [Sinanodonta woodiana]|uniref:Uncharacterized protein n=1 Tax=Sinanodonta woodiana TaxID=1069815 RepID=A0ABD3UT48_SINWO